MLVVLTRSQSGHGWCLLRSSGWDGSEHLEMEIILRNKLMLGCNVWYISGDFFWPNLIKYSYGKLKLPVIIKGPEGLQKVFWLFYTDLIHTLYLFRNFCPFPGKFWSKCWKIFDQNFPLLYKYSITWSYKINNIPLLLFPALGLSITFFSSTWYTSK